MTGQTVRYDRSEEERPERAVIEEIFGNSSPEHEDEVYPPGRLERRPIDRLLEAHQDLGPSAAGLPLPRNLPQTFGPSRGSASSDQPVEPVQVPLEPVGLPLLAPPAPDPGWLEEDDLESEDSDVCSSHSSRCTSSSTGIPGEWSERTRDTVRMVGPHASPLSPVMEEALEEASPEYAMGGEPQFFRAVRAEQRRRGNPDDDPDRVDGRVAARPGWTLTIALWINGLPIRTVCDTGSGRDLILKPLASALRRHTTTRENCVVRKALTNPFTCGTVVEGTQTGTIEHVQTLRGAFREARNGTDPPKEVLMEIELEEIGDISAAVILGAPTLMRMGMVPYDDHIEFTRLGIDVPLVPERGALPVQLLRARNLTAEGVPLNWHQQARIQVGEPFRIVGPAVVEVPVRVRWPDPPQQLD